ncbi:hypothetical protein [Mucilaginibacter sp. CSA2-8R]|uniref:hypothetical protein n=1 Tax=Mucilaginibacter sp. CSA2-8R TaxID=3141542 RepID=UPI00315D8557
MTIEERKYDLSTQVYRQLVKNITENMRFLYLDIDMEEHDMMLTAYFATEPTEVELELLDDIATNSSAPLPDFSVSYNYKLTSEHQENEKHDYLIFAYYDGED